MAAEPPSPSRNPVRAPSHLPVASSALRTPRRCSTAFPRLKPTPGVPDLANSGEPEPHAAAELCSGDSAAAFRAPTDPSRQISSQRLRLDRDLVYPEPSDPDPAVQIGAYPFSLANFIKSPCPFSDSTRSPF